MKKFEKIADKSPLIDIADIGRNWREALGVGFEPSMGAHTSRTIEHGFHGVGPEHYFNGVLIERYRVGKTDFQMGLWMTISGRHMFIEIRDDGSEPEYTGEKKAGQSNIEIIIKNIDPITDETVGMVGYRWYGSEGKWRFWDYSYCLGKADIGDILAGLDEQIELERKGIQDRLLTSVDKQLITQIFEGKIEGNLPVYMGENATGGTLVDYVAAVDSGRNDGGCDET